MLDPHIQRLIDQVDDLCEGRIARNARIKALEEALSEIHDEMGQFGAYCRSVAADAMGLNRQTWTERAEWAERLAARSSPSTDAPSTGDALSVADQTKEDR